MNNTSELISIGIFSMITRLTRRALRLYDEKGLLSPAKKEITGYRQYSYRQIRRGMQLKRLADLGFGINEMKEIMDTLTGFPEEEKLGAILTKRLDEVNNEISRLEKIRGSLINKSFMEVINFKQSEPIVKEVSNQRVVSRREKGTYQDVIPRLIGEICKTVFSSENQQAQVRCIGPPIAIYHDDEHHLCKEMDADIEVALPISGNITVGPEYEVKILKEGTVVAYIYKGPYQDVGSAWNEVFKYIDMKDLKVAGNCRDIYLNDPNETPEAELLTGIQVPIVE